MPVKQNECALLVYVFTHKAADCLTFFTQSPKHGYIVGSGEWQFWEIMRQDTVFEVKLKALKTRLPEQPQESRTVDLLLLIRKMHLKMFAQIFSAFPHKERSSDFYRLFKNGCWTFLKRRLVAICPSGVILPRQHPETFQLRFIVGSYLLNRSYRYQLLPIFLISVFLGRSNVKM